MSKTVRIILYILSILTVLGVLAALLTTGSAGRARRTMQQGNQPFAESGQSAQDKDLDASFAVGETESQEAGDGQSEQTQESEISSTADGTGQSEDVEQERVTSDGDTTILFAGDVLLAHRAVAAGYDANGLDGVIAPELQRELQSADILMVNNEFAFSDRGAPVADKQYTFACSPTYVKVLSEMGVDVVTLANNHTLDYGKDALRDTFETLDNAGILYGGAGETVERAQEVQMIEVNGRTYGFLAVSRVIPSVDWKVENSAPGIFSCYDDTRLLELIREAKEKCDFLAVYPHWGVEREAYPEDYQIRIAQRCIEAGADMIVGAHSHCLQGVSYIEGKPVFYSMGNFIFGYTNEQSAVLKVTVDADGNASFRYIPVYAAGGVTYLADGEKSAQICQYIDSISEASVGADGAVAE